jgi:iron(III) transport system permease protein
MEVIEAAQHSQPATIKSLNRTPPLVWFAIGLSLLLSLPLLLIFTSWLFESDGGLGYLSKQGLLATYTANSIIITIGTSIITLILGVSTAFYVTCTNMPFKSLMRWLVMTPFAVPGYVAAIVYADLFDSAGSIQTFIRTFWNLEYGEYWFPSIRSIEGCIFILSITLYPYVYLLACTAFSSQPRHMLETGQLLGLNNRSLFLKVMLPMARPMIVVGVALVMMEALSDFGVVSLFGISTYTTGIYRSWQGLYDPIAAAQMASLLLICVLAVLWLERRSRAKERYANPNTVNAPQLLFKLSSYGKGLSFAWCLLPVLLGFFVPVAVLLYWASSLWGAFFDQYTLDALMNSLTLGVLTAALATGIGVLLTITMRFYPSSFLGFATRIATSGYAMPGSVVAVGILLLLITIQNHILGGEFLLTGTIAAMVWACSFRFLTISFNTTESGLTRITPMMDESAKTLGHSTFSVVRNIHLPLVYRSLLVGFLLVFVDTVKELPATILLRPFNFDTLAIRAYELAGDELLQRAGPSALLLVLFSIIPIILLAKQVLSQHGADNKEG